MVTDTDTETATATDTDTETDTATDTDTETATTTDIDTETATATKSTRICSGLPQTNSIHFQLKSYKFPEKNLFNHQANKAASEVHGITFLKPESLVIFLVPASWSTEPATINKVAL